MRKTLFTIAILTIIALPAAAQAQGGGNSGTDQYVENVPGAGGDRPASGGSGDGSGGTLPPSTVRALEAQGTDGAAAAALAQRTGQGSGEKGNANDASAGPGDAGSGSATDGGGVGNLLGEIASGGEGSDEGMGPLLPIILGATLLGAIVFFTLRRRGQTEPGEPA